jgi:splicing factor U2AF subunit
MQFAKYGEIEDLVVADNIGDHMIGNVWIKFVNEDAAKASMTAMQGLFYAGRTIVAEFVPVTDFREAKCRKHTEGHCDRGGYCNFLHPKYVSREQKKTMFKWMYNEYPVYKAAKKERDENPDNIPKNSRSRSRSRDRIVPRREERPQRSSDRHERHRPIERDTRVERVDRY